MQILRYDQVASFNMPPDYSFDGAVIEGAKLNIYIDPEPGNPRTEFDNFGRMVCFHRGHILGDKHDIDPDQFTTISIDGENPEDPWKKCEKYLIKKKGAVVILPLYLYDHSGITMRTYPFGDRWDSGRVGFIYATRDDILKEYEHIKAKNVTKWMKEKAATILRSEVEVYDDYISGNVYGYEIVDKHGKVLESSWGYYGTDAVEEIKKEMHIQENTGSTGATAELATPAVG